MPHQCTNCNRTFPDGSKEMLSGCPDCGGNKFQFTPAGRDDGTTDGSEPPERSSSRPAGDRDQEPRDWPDSGKRPSDRSNAAESKSGAATTGPDASTGDAGRSWPQSTDEASRRDVDPTGRTGNGTPKRTGDGPPKRSRDDATASRTPDDSDEDTAQASARSDVVSPDELPSHEPEDGPSFPSDEGRVVSEPDDSDHDRPSLSELREELNDQFESIKIVRPGEYELNLMELYDREEYIVSLQEDGRYVIDVPDSWREGEDDT